MKFFLDDECILELSEVELKILGHEIGSSHLKNEIKRRAVYSILHKRDRIFDRLKKEWEPKLANIGHQMIPTDRDKFAELVFECKEYKCRKQRDDAGEQSVNHWDNQTDGPRPK